MTIEFQLRDRLSKAEPKGVHLPKHSEMNPTLPQRITTHCRSCITVTVYLLGFRGMLKSVF